MNSLPALDQVLTPDQKENLQKLSQLVAQAGADESFKQRLMANPSEVLESHGIKVREGLEIRVVENTDKVQYLTLPATSSELTPDLLNGITGGIVALDYLMLATILGMALVVGVSATSAPNGQKSDSSRTTRASAG